MKRFFLFIGNLAASIVENVSTQAEEQPLCKTYTRRSELFRTNHFWRVDKVSDEIKPHNKKQEILQQSLIVLTFFHRKSFLLQFCNRLQRVLLENKVILQACNLGVSLRTADAFPVVASLPPGVICSLCFCFDELSIYKWTEPWNIKGRFPELWGLWASVSSSALPLPLPFFLLPLKLSRYNSTGNACDTG